MFLYSVHDSLAGRWHVPYCMENDSVAIRAFLATVGQSGSPLNTSPGDFALYKVGTFEPETGAIGAEATPVRIISALEAVHVLAASKKIEDERQLSLA